MEVSTKEKRNSKKSKLLSDTAVEGLKVFAQGALTGLGMRVGANLYDRFKTKNYRANVSDLRKQG